MYSDFSDSLVILSPYKGTFPYAFSHCFKINNHNGREKNLFYVLKSSNLTLLSISLSSPVPLFPPSPLFHKSNFHKGRTVVEVK